MVTIQQIGAEELAAYASVAIAFEVHSVLAVEAANGGLGGLVLRERPVAPYRKDYDALALAEGPTNWPRQFDVSNWAIWLARDKSETVGGAAVAWHTPGVHMLEGAVDLAVLWDIRVQPGRRGQGIGSALFRQAATWARSRGCRYLKVETQNVNVDACRFYAKMGCFLGQIHQLGYRTCPEVRDEAMLIWYLDLRTTE